MSYSKYNVKKMAEALQSGATMMAVHCESCSAPLFKHRDGRIECVNCGKLYRFTKGGKGVEELPPMESGREDAMSLLREIEKQLMNVKDEHRMNSVINTLRKLRDELSGTG
ncbi:MAG: Sjogren's syndrome/scleroderma autoantigen 1 family protein [Thermoproteota archaeon]